MWTAEQIEAQRRADEERVAELRRDLMRTDAFIDFQPRVSPHLERRPDLAPIFDVFERVYAAARGEAKPIIALVSAPPQVGKTSAGQHACAGILKRDPTMWCFYITYNDDLARIKSRDVRDYARASGVDIRTDSSAVDRWQTKQGGGFLARGRDGGITGQSKPDLVWLDDPYKDRSEAESAAISGSIADMLSGVIVTRRHPRTSIVISHTRWTTTDVIARTKEKLAGKIDELGVDLVEVSLPCVDDAGEPLITFGGRDRNFYAAQRLLTTEHDWWSLFMCAPRPRTGKLFRGVNLCDTRPSRRAIAIGMDLAYSKKRDGDWCAAAVMCRDLDEPPEFVQLGNKQVRLRPRSYLMRMERAREPLDQWCRRMRALQEAFGGAAIYMRGGGQEEALLDTMRDAYGLHVTFERTVGDKLQNALVCSDDWNAGRVLTLTDSEWDRAGFVERALDFSGQSDAEVDDEIDAMVTAHGRLTVSGWESSSAPVAIGAGRVAAARGWW